MLPRHQNCFEEREKRQGASSAQVHINGPGKQPFICMYLCHQFHYNDH